MGRTGPDGDGTESGPYVEMLRREADRAAWMQTGVIVLGLIVGLSRGPGRGIPDLAWVR